jgi:septin family protein
MAKGDLHRPKISFDGPAEPRIINATPESCLVKQPNTKPTKEKLAKKSMQKNIRTIVNSASKNQSFGEIPEPLTSMGGATIVPASEEKVSLTIFAQLNRIKEEAKKVQTIEAELNEEKKKLAGDLEALKKKIADQEREWTQYFDAIRKEMARLTLT